MTENKRRFYSAIFFVYLLVMGFIAYATGAGIRENRDLAAARAELAAVRDSLRVERADLIACYQGRTPAPDSLDWSKLDADTVRSGRVVVWP